MKRTAFLLCLLLSLFSCADKKGKTTGDLNPKKGAFSISLIPIAECLPLYYAVERGYDTAKKFPLDIHTYMAQCDVSAALADSTDAGFACLESAEHLMSSEKYVKALTLSGKWTFLSSPASRIRKTGDLADRVVAVAPGTLTEKIAKEAASKAGLGGETVMYPHVVGYNTATSMLIFNQIDATVLPEPYASYAISERAASIATSFEDTSGYILVKSNRKSKFNDSEIHKKLQELYNMAVDSLAGADSETIDHLLQSVCKISPKETGKRTLKLKKAK